MNSEKLETSHNISIQPSDSSLIYNPNSPSEETKKLLSSLLKKRLEKRITKLENKTKEERGALKYTYKKFNEFKNLLSLLSKGFNEKMKEKELAFKKKEESKKEKFESKTHNSKSVAPQKKLKIITKNDFLTNRTERSNNNKIRINNINTHNYKTEIVPKEHIRPKTYKGPRIQHDPEKNRIKVKQIKIEKIANASSPQRPEDNKAKTIMNFSSERKEEKKNHTSILYKKSQSIKKRLKPNDLNLNKALSDIGNNSKKIDKYTSEKADKKSITIIQDKIDKKRDDKKITGKKIINKKPNDKIKKAQPKKEKKVEDKTEESKEKEQKIENKEKEEKKNTEKNECEKEEKNNIEKEQTFQVEDKEEDKERKIEKKDEPNKEIEENKQEKAENLEEKNDKLIEKDNIKEDKPKEKETINEEETRKEDAIKKDSQLKMNEEIKETTIKLSPKEEIPNNKIEEQNEQKEIEVTKPNELIPETNSNEQKEIIKEEPKSSLEIKPSEIIKEETKETEEKKEPLIKEEEAKQNDMNNDNKTSNENNTNLEQSKKEEIILEKNNDNEIQKAVNEKNEHLIENIRKDNEEMKKENEEELLKHYQSQLIDINLNQSMNQSMSFSQSFLQSQSILGERSKEKVVRDPNAPLTLDEIIKKYKNDFIYVFDFLEFNERIQFSGIHKGFKNERIYLLNTKREEAISSLELKEKETLDDRINQFKLKFSSSEYTKPLGTFVVAKSSLNAVMSLDKEMFSKLFRQKVLDIKLSDIYIAYRVLFVFMGEPKIAEIIDDNEFWLKCIEYLNEKGKDKIGSFIFEKSKNFDFSHKSIYLLNKLLVGIKPKMVPGTFSKCSGTTGLLFFIIKDALEFSGILVSNKTPKNRIYDNLLYYKNIIDSLTNFIDFLSKIKVNKY